MLVADGSVEVALGQVSEIQKNPSKLLLALPLQRERALKLLEGDQIAFDQQLTDKFPDQIDDLKIFQPQSCPGYKFRQAGFVRLSVEPASRIELLSSSWSLH